MTSLAGRTIVMSGRSRGSGRPCCATLSPPINLAPEWLGKFPAYMISKRGMSLLTPGRAAEFAAGDDGAGGIRANCLWPQTTIATAAMASLLRGAEAAAWARIPVIKSGTDDPELDFFVDAH